MSAYVVDVATVDGIVSGARQYGGQEGFSFVRLFRDTATDRGGYSYHKFSRYAADEEAPDTFNPNTIGRELWGENVRSIHARYPDTIGGENLPGAGTFTEAEVIAYQYGPAGRVVDVDPFGLMGAIRGYRYQACEHDGWHYSIAEAFISALEAEVIRYLIDATGANAWTIDQLSEIEGDTLITPSERGYLIEHRQRPGTGAVSLLEMMQRERDA